MTAGPAGERGAAAREPLVIAGEVCPPGTRRRLEIPVARLQTEAEAGLPVTVIHGALDGPRVWANAAIHGDELNGVEVIRRLLAELEPRRLRGTFIAVPIVNVFGFLAQSRYLPDRRDLNRSFPGSPRGSLAARLAHRFVTEIVARCSIGIDLHTGSDARTNLPQVRADLDDPETLRLAQAFAAPITMDARLRDGSLRKVAARRGARVLLYEGGEPLRFGEEAIECGVAGVLRVLESLGMIEGAPAAPRPTMVAHTSRWVRASRSGLFHGERALGDEVSQGERVGFLTTPYDARRTPVKSPVAGVVIGLATNPLVFQGDALVHVASPAEG